MKHPHHALDAVLDFEPESTGQPIVVGQPPPPMQESAHVPAARSHDPAPPSDSHQPDASGAPDRL